MNSIKVLCVENRESDSHILRALLEQAGYEVIPAASGAEALLILERECVHGVLLEYDLPDKTGETVREEMARLTPDLPVLLFSGVGSHTPFLLRLFGEYLKCSDCEEGEIERAS